MKPIRKITAGKFLATAAIVVIAAPMIFLAYYQYNNRLFLFEAEILWGSNPFNAMEFHTASPKSRASMAVDLIKSNIYIGNRCDSIPEILGEKTGDYYHSDSNSTYRLTDKQSANWILTFICGEAGTIESVIVRKGCCSTSQKLVYWFVDLLSN